MNLRSDLRTARRTSGKQWRLLAEAGGLLVVARLVVWFVPFRSLATRLGEEMAESPAADTEAQRAAALPIGWAVRTLGRRLPWMSQCLVQAVAATWMLQRRRIPSTLYFGMAKDSDGKLTAHAWVRCGTQVLTGAKGRHEFTVVATFAESGLGSGPDCAVPRIVTGGGTERPDERDLR
jgi:hypothetical protein